jgi:glucose-1-phosphate thymidylyltransferase
VNNYYINEDVMGYRILNGFWSDAGTFESLFRANELVRDFSQK